MITLRLSRSGKKGQKFYRVVAIEKSKKSTGKNFEILGFWNPTKKTFKINKVKYEKWVAKGAILSSSLKKLIQE